MSSNKSDLIMVGPKKQLFIDRLSPVFNVHVFNDVNQSVVPALLPFLVTQYGLSYAAAASLVPRSASSVTL